MARLLPEDANETAWNADARFKVELSSGESVELWERALDFDEPLSSARKYREAGTFTSSSAVQRRVDPGTFYQARLYRAGEGDSSGTGRILGKLDYPGINYESRVPFLTQCTEGSIPQLKIDAGGTFVPVTVAGGVPSRVRVQVGVGRPQVDGLGLPAFEPDQVVASSISEDVNFVHNVVLIDELTQSDTEGHARMLAGQELFYVVLAWDQNASFDYVWARNGAAPNEEPDSVVTKQRTVEVRLTELVCLDDSDDLSDGEARFTLTVIDGAGETTRTVNWPEMPTGASLPIRDGSTDVVVNPPDAAGDVRVRVDCREDDSPADDDLASTSLTLTGGSALDFPVGPQERVDRRSITLGSRPLTVDNDLKFIARLMYSVGYR